MVDALDQQVARSPEPSRPLDNKMGVTPAFYSDRQLDVITGLNPVTRWRMRKRGEFPEPVQLSPGRVGYPARLVDAWIAERMGASSDAA